MSEEKKFGKGGYLIYKCRLCGEEFKPTHAPDIHLAVMALVYDFVQMPESWFGVRPNAVEIHHHKGGYGVADLIGGTHDET